MRFYVLYLRFKWPQLLKDEGCWMSVIVRWFTCLGFIRFKKYFSGLFFIILEFIIIIFFTSLISLTESLFGHFLCRYDSLWEKDFLRLNFDLTADAAQKRWSRCGTGSGPLPFSVSPVGGLVKHQQIKKLHTLDCSSNWYLIFNSVCAISYSKSKT